MQKDTSSHRPKENTARKGVFLNYIRILPDPLKKKFLGVSAAAVLVAAIILAMMIYFSDIRFGVGFLICGYLAFVGLDIVWSFAKGKIQHRKLICFTVEKHPIMNCLDVICQEYGAEAHTEEKVQEFYVPNTKKNKAVFSQGTVIDAYYRPDAPYELVAWAVLGSVIIVK